MKILFLGDVVGRSGRDGIQKHLPGLRTRLAVDFAVVNGENAAGGVGITDEIAREFYEAGADVVTTGNHVWDPREIIATIDRDDNGALVPIIAVATEPQARAAAALMREHGNPTAAPEARR